jgi:hypothetical protein
VVIRITRCFFWDFLWEARCLSSEAVQSPALPLEGVDDVECCHGLAAGVLGVGDCITDDVLQEHLEHPPGLLVDQARDALDTSTTCQPSDGGLGDALDVVSQDLPVPLGSSLACRCFCVSELVLRAWFVGLSREDERFVCVSALRLQGAAGPMEVCGIGVGTGEWIECNDVGDHWLGDLVDA